MNTIRKEYKEGTSGSYTLSEVCPAFTTLIQKVYLWMTFALVITGMTAYITAETTAILHIVITNKMVFYALLIAEVMLVVCITAALHKLTIIQATALFVIYSFLNGITMSFLLLVYTGQSVASVFLITAGTFAIMSAWGYTTGKDLTTMGKMLTMALIGMILATVVNLFLHNGTLMSIISYVGVIVFVGLTAYDTQKIKKMLLEAQETDEGQKIALFGALSLYLDFINLFIYLLRILGSRK